MLIEAVAQAIPSYAMSVFNCQVIFISLSSLLLITSGGAAIRKNGRFIGCVKRSCVTQRMIGG